MYGDSDKLKVRAGISTNFIYFTIGYFVAIGATVNGLMVYNLLKMFGLDIVIDDTIKNFLEWFTDT